MLRYESLHNHTSDSDGQLAVIELLNAAEKHGIGIMAITDHDIVPTAATLAQLRAYTGPVKWLVGVELSCRLPKELGDGKESYVHVLGYFIDLQNEVLAQRLSELEEGRRQRVAVMVKHLQAIGLMVSEEDCLAQATGRAIGSPHVVKAVMAHPENLAVIKRLRRELEADAQHNEALALLVQQLETDGPNQEPYALFMKEHSYKPMPSANNSVPSLDEGVALIRQAGGVALLAHWHFAKEHLPLADLEKLLADGRLDGVETFVENVIVDRDLGPETAELEGLVSRQHCLAAFGSDAHDECDLVAFAAHPKAQESVGQTQRLVERVKPDLTYSNLG